MGANNRRTSPYSNSRLFRSRDPETLLLELREFLSARIPLDVFDLSIYSYKENSLRFFAIVTKEGPIFTDDSVRLPKNDMREIRSLPHEPVRLYGNSLQFPSIQEICFRYPYPQPFSTVSISLPIGEGNYACINASAVGADQYTSDHIEFVRSHYDQITWCGRYILSRLEVSSLQTRLSEQHEEIVKRLGFLGIDQIVGCESGLKEVMSLVRKVAPLGSPVLITGETGVGKEVVANAIHRGSKRAKGPMVSVNCGAIPETLLDSELFGHEKGAFTGATVQKRGFFEQANEGTIFLDEIGELPFSAQVRLLRLLQTMEFQRVGGSRPIRTDARVIAATNRNLHAAMKNDLFRKDLWFRISVFPINVPPLRERREDIAELAAYFARRKTQEMSLPWRPLFAEGAMAQLRAYHWPGNVRELQNVIERAMIVSAGSPMSFPNLQFGDGTSNEESPLTMRAAMREHITKCLKLAKGRIEGRGGAAEILDMHHSTLRAKMHRLGIRRDEI